MSCVLILGGLIVLAFCCGWRCCEHERSIREIGSCKKLYGIMTRGCFGFRKVSRDEPIIVQKHLKVEKLRAKLESAELIIDGPFDGSLRINGQEASNFTDVTIRAPMGDVPQMDVTFVILPKPVEEKEGA